MKRVILVWFSILTFLAAPVLGAPIPAEPEDAVAQAVFATDSQLKETQEADPHGIGLALQNADGWGLVYNKKIASRRYVWGEIVYTPDRPLFLESFAPSPQSAYADIHETNRVQIMAGVDRVIHVTQNRYWGFVLGLGAGLNRSEYRSKYYRQLCTFYCGFDPRSPTEKNETDLFGFISGRAGVGFLETQVWGLKGDFRILMTPLLARSGRFIFSGPDGREVKRAAFGSYVAEALVTF